MLGARRDPQLRRGRAGAPRARLPRPRAQGGLAGRRARQARPLGCSRRARRSPRRPTGSSTPTSRGSCARRGAGLVGRRRRRCSTRRARCSTTPPHAYGHVIVDEAQDLTPMQLRMVARRARDGSLTILGDVAQATGAVAYRSWDEVLPHLPRGDEADGRGAAARLPRAARDHGASRCRCSTTIAPDVAPPISYRTGAAPPTVRRVDEEHLLAEALREAARLAAAGRAARRDRPRRARSATSPPGDLWDGVPLLTPRAGEGARVRPRRRRRAGADRGARAGPARALRRADAADEDARRRARAAAARRALGGNERARRLPDGSSRLGAADLRAASCVAIDASSGSTIV